MQQIFSPVQQGSLKDAVYTRVRAAILGGEIPAGTRLLEVEMAQSMGVSRAPIREALAHLEQEGLVVSRPNRGTYVAEIFSQQDVHEITTLRSALETMAIGIAAAKIDEAEIECLAELVERMQTAAEGGDLALLADLDNQFHSRLVQAAKHARLYQMWSTLAGQYWALYLTQLHQMERQSGLTHADAREHHKPIVDALRERNTALATIYLQRNILYGTHHLMLPFPGATPEEEEEEEDGSISTDQGPD